MNRPISLAPRASTLVLCGVTLGACGLVGPDDPKAPPIAAGYPQLEALEDGRAELQIGGRDFVGDASGGLVIADDGFEDELRVDLTLSDAPRENTLLIQLRDVEVGSKSIEDGDLAAAYTTLTDLYGQSPEVAELLGEEPDDCSTGTVELVDRARYDSGYDGEKEAAWGTVNLQLCDYDEDESIEISGRFAAVVWRI